MMLVNQKCENITNNASVNISCVCGYAITTLGLAFVAAQSLNCGGW